MKHVMMMSLSILMLMIGINHSNAQSENDKYSYTTLKVDMKCNACAEKVKTQLAYVKGVKDVKPDHVNDEVHVKYLSKKCSTDDLIASLAEIEYSAKVKGENASAGTKSPCSSQQKKACGGEKAPCATKKTE
jgi:copper chaperone CopZ